MTALRTKTAYFVGLVLALLMMGATLVAHPAHADPINSSIHQQARSGDVDLSANINASGDNSNQAAPVLQFANTGNNQNAFTLNGFGSKNDEVMIWGGSLVFSPEFQAYSNQTIQQAAVAN